MRGVYIRVHSTLVAQASRDATAGTFTLPSKSYSPHGNSPVITRLRMPSYTRRGLYLQPRILDPVQPSSRAFGTFNILPATSPVANSSSVVDFTRGEGVDLDLESLKSPIVRNRPGHGASSSRSPAVVDPILTIIFEGLEPRTTCNLGRKL